MTILHFILDSLDERYKNLCVIKEKHLKSTKQYYNITVRLKPSKYHDNSATAVLCRVYLGFLDFEKSNERITGLNTHLLAEVVNKEIRLLYSFLLFNCCSKYMECSNARECVHEDYFYSDSCVYRRRIESGKIFYGVNRNV